jgi:RNA polymerase primary sigma factor
MSEGSELKFALSAEAVGDLGDCSDEDDILVMYMHEIGRIPVLSKDRELELFKLMDRAKRRMRRLLRLASGILGRAELKGSEDLRYAVGEIEDEEVRARLMKIAQQVERFEREIAGAREEIIKGNLRLPLFIARRYKDRGLPLMDLIQEGNAGLMVAVDRFDYRRGAKFSSYASIWIQQAIGYAIANHSRTVRIPVYLHDMLRKVSKAMERFISKNSREPTVEELSQITGIPLEKIKLIRRLSTGTTSLDEFVSSEDDARMMDFIPDDRLNPENEVVRKFMRREIEQMIDSLPERERQILRLRYGFDDGRFHSLQEVGERLNLSRERIRQIETRALNRLRHPAKSSRLREYLA